MQYSKILRILLFWGFCGSVVNRSSLNRPTNVPVPSNRAINTNANKNNEVQRIERTSISHLIPTNRRRPALLTDTSNRKKMILEVRTICKNLSFQFNELRTSVYYLLLFLLLWITVCSYKVDDYLQRKEISKSTSEWTECIFTIFQNNKNNCKLPN